MAPASISWIHIGIFSETYLFGPGCDCVCHLPIALESSGFSFGSRSVGGWQMQSDFDLIWSFLDLVKSSQVLTVITLFRLFWYQTESVWCQSDRRGSCYSPGLIRFWRVLGDVPLYSSGKSHGSCFKFLYNTHREVLSKSCWFGQRSGCVCHFPIDLEPNGLPFGSKVVGGW